VIHISRFVQFSEDALHVVKGDVVSDRWRRRRRRRKEEGKVKESLLWDLCNQISI
jgi:hypothetical protein